MLPRFPNVTEKEWIWRQILLLISKFWEDHQVSDKLFAAWSFQQFYTRHLHRERIQSLLQGEGQRVDPNQMFLSISVVLGAAALELSCAVFCCYSLALLVSDNRKTSTLPVPPMPTFSIYLSVLRTVLLPAENCVSFIFASQIMWGLQCSLNSCYLVLLRWLNLIVNLTGLQRAYISKTYLWACWWGINWRVEVLS
jgi:hypothetical protein